MTPDARVLEVAPEDWVPFFTKEMLMCTDWEALPHFCVKDGCLRSSNPEGALCTPLADLPFSKIVWLSKSRPLMRIGTGWLSVPLQRD
jgi:hypothetical protein